MPQLEERVLEAIDTDELLDDARRLIEVKSLGGAETPAQELSAELMRAAGLDVDLWPIDFDALGRHPAYSAEVDRREGLGVVGSLGDGDGGRTLVLNGHVDVVPVGDETAWSRPPWRGTVDGGRLWGRGSADMKGGLCCALAAARAIVRSGVRLEGRLLVQSVGGEEDGGCGTLATLERGYRGDGAVIMEPTALQVIPVQAGALSFRLTIEGRAAHGSMRDEGVSALERFFPVHQALLELERRKNEELRHPLYEGYRLPWPLSIGIVRAGDWASTVPERLVAEGRYGVAPGEDLAAARRRFEDAVAEAAAADPWLARHPPRVEWWGGQFAPAETPPDADVVVELERAFAELTGAPPAKTGATYGADLRLLVLEGRVPTVLFGPGDVRRAHTVDEFVPIEELETAARTLALLTLRFCGGLPPAGSKD